MRFTGAPQKRGGCIWATPAECADERKRLCFTSDTLLFWVCSMPSTRKVRYINRAPHCLWDNTTKHKSNYSFHRIGDDFPQPKKFLHFRCVSGCRRREHTMHLHLFFSLTPLAMEERPRHSPCPRCVTLLVPPIVLCPGQSSPHQDCLSKHRWFFVLHFDEHLQQGAPLCLWAQELSVMLGSGSFWFIWNYSSYITAVR